MIALVIVSALGGGLAGGCAGWLGARHRTTRSDNVPPIVANVDFDQRVNDAARAWAIANDRPGAEPLVANKLRLAAELRRQSRR